MIIHDWRYYILDNFIDYVHWDSSGFSVFSKANARELLLPNNIELKDDFEIVEHKTTWAIGDFYQRFELKISNNDKLRLAKEFKEKSDSINILIEKYPTLFKEYRENSEGFFKENAKNSEIEEDYIFISKNENKLIYELVQEWNNLSLLHYLFFFRLMANQNRFSVVAFDFGWRQNHGTIRH